MKKMLLAVFVFAGVMSAANARPCSVTLEDRRGDVIRHFTGYGQNSCREALSECKQEMQYYRHRSGLRCRQQTTRPPSRQSCEYSIVTRRGNIVESFRDAGRDACWSAQRQCEDNLWRRQRNGRNPHATCERTSGNTRPGRDTVTRSCSVKRVAPRFGIMERYSASASGLRGSGVKDRACTKALRKCERDTVRRQYCEIIR